MPRKKIFLNSHPEVSEPMMKGMIVLLSFFSLFGVVFIVIAITDADEVWFIPAFFGLIWFVACGAMIAHVARMLKMAKKGKIEVAEITEGGAEPSGGFAEKLRDLEELKRDGLISDFEYQQKREEIMREKW